MTKIDYYRARLRLARWNSNQTMMLDVIASALVDLLEVLTKEEEQ